MRHGLAPTTEGDPTVEDDAAVARLRLSKARTPEWLSWAQTPHMHISHMRHTLLFRVQSELPGSICYSFWAWCGIPPPCLSQTAGQKVESPGSCLWKCTGELTAVSHHAGRGTSGLGSGATGHAPESFLNRSIWGPPARTHCEGCPWFPGGMPIPVASEWVQHHRGPAL